MTNPASQYVPARIAKLADSDIVFQIAFDRRDIESNVPARWERVVDLLPDHIAIQDQECRWTYCELDKRVNQIAHAILNHSQPGRDCVAYLVDHSPDIVICALAALKAGKAYLCIHPHVPTAVQQAILCDTLPDLVLTSRTLEPRAREIAGDRCGIVILEDIGDQATGKRPQAAIRPDDPAVIFYTSGSTGRPKGVVKSHRAVLHRAWLCAQYDHIHQADRHSLLTYCSFATTESDVFGTLLNGATLCLFDLASQGVADFADWIDREQVTVLHPPVLLFRRFLSTLNGENLFPSVRLVALAGETVVASDLESWRRHFSKTSALHHRFSSTEAGHISVACIEPNAALTPGVVPPGRPVTDKHLRLVDEQDREVAAGEVGELLVQSAYLSDGYWRRPQESALAFTVDADRPHERVFRTGDLGRMGHDGTFEFLGRRDNQVKIRGYRVELKEVENALLSLDAVQEAAVVTQQIDDETRLVAYVVHKPGQSLQIEPLRSELRKVLPEWKVPAKFLVLSSFPLTPNGKIDRQALPMPDDSRPDLESEYVAPRSPLEERLAGIWCELLGLKRVGIHDNFFDAGGNSLLAMRLFARMSQEFGCKMPLAVLFQQGTIAQLAVLLAQSTSADGMISVLPLQPSGDGRPLFLMPSIGGELLFARNLIRELGVKFPIIGLQPALAAKNLEQFQDFRTTGRNFVGALRNYQPRGPYALAGYSYGALMAYEVACVLADEGEQVDQLVVMDWGPGRRGLDGRTGDHWGRWSRFLRNLPVWLREETRHFSASRLAGNAIRKMRRQFRRLATPHAVPIALDDAFDINHIPSQNLEIMRAVYAAYRDYVPRTYRGQLTLIRAEARPLFADSAPDLGWHRFVDKLTVHHVPGNHESILHPPHVQELARLLADVMQDLAP